jgi:hypothetical protein
MSVYLKPEYRAMALRVAASPTPGDAELLALSNPAAVAAWLRRLSELEVAAIAMGVQLELQGQAIDVAGKGWQEELDRVRRVHELQFAEAKDANDKLRAAVAARKELALAKEELDHYRAVAAARMAAGQEEEERRRRADIDEMSNAKAIREGGG